MAKRGNRVQVILECTEIKELEKQELLATLLLKTKRTLQTEWN